jgi:hypothetical protein
LLGEGRRREAQDLPAIDLGLLEIEAVISLLWSGPL